MSSGSTQTPEKLYQQALQSGEYQPDNVQYQTVKALTQVQQALIARSQAPVSSQPGLVKRVKRIFSRTQYIEQPVIGLYLWGGVGRGKTWLMDLFFTSLPGNRKLRLHFHRFMLRVQEELTQLQGHENPLEVIADGFKAQTDVLCFDEFFVSDIADAMLLGTLLQALFSRGITLIATSNIPPDDLYHNGLQRARFLPAIALIKQYCTIMNVDAGIDYRLRTLTQAHLYLSPINTQNEDRMLQMFQCIVGGRGEEKQTITLNHRPFPTLRCAQGVVAVSFVALCEEARSSLDYIVLSQCYHTVFVHNVTVMGPKQENTARRFLALVDEFYERHVKLIINAECAMDTLYQGEQLAFEYQRCLSRLQEMQSEAYLSLAHLP